MVERDRFREWRYALDELTVKTIGSIGLAMETYSAGPETLHFQPKLFGELRAGNYDAFVSTSWTQGFTMMTLAAGRAWHKPAILWEMSIPHPASRKKRAAMPLIRALLRSYSGCIAGSTKCKTYLTSLGCDPARVFVVRHPIDYEFFSQDLTADEKMALRRELGLALDRPIILFVGQYIERKGIRELLAAWNLLKTEYSATAQLVLIGSGSLKAEIDQFVAQHDLADSVTVNGYVQHDELRTWYGASDIFVMPSRYEAFGAVAGEAMASGLPVITTRAVGAEPDLIRDKDNGLVIPPADASALANALLRLLNDSDLRGRMRGRALLTAKEYATPGITDEFVHAVSTVCANFPSRDRVRR